MANYPSWGRSAQNHTRAGARAGSLEGPKRRSDRRSSDRVCRSVPAAWAARASPGQEPVDVADGQPGQRGSANAGHAAHAVAGVPQHWQHSYLSSRRRALAYLQARRSRRITRQKRGHSCSRVLATTFGYRRGTLPAACVERFVTARRIIPGRRVLFVRWCGSSVQWRARYTRPDFL